MFFRVKTSGPRACLRIVENRREHGAHRQHVIATLGRIDELEASGRLAAFLASGARLSQHVMLLSALGDHRKEPRLAMRRIGAPLLFGRLWERLGIAEVLRDRLAGRCFGFDVKRAILASPPPRNTLA